MSNGDETAAVAASSLTINRIFIGGLSASVTAADLEKTFSPLGEVHNIEIVHSDGRSFAYMDFKPHSDKALAKLFAVYNGCSWKGGKLKLEKAKEHYLVRLKREWAEDAKVSVPLDVDVEKSSDHSDKSENLNQENANLRIFFPKLRKVKTLPFKGTGKHKYSFQRVEVPSLPIHFCDCEEHCGPSEMANETYISALNSAAYEKERCIMTSVMNKLLEKEENEAPTSWTRSFSAEAVAIDASDDDIQLKQAEEAEETDADNLVTNIGIGESDDMLMQLLGKKTHSADQVHDSGIDWPEPSTDGLPQNKARSQKRQKTTSIVTSEVTSSQAASPTVVQDSRIDRPKPSTDGLPQNKASRKRQNTTSIVTSEVTSSQTASATVVGTEDEFTSILTRSESLRDAKKEEVLAEDSPDKSQIEHAASTVISASSNTWIQKSSWRDLVGESGNSTFSISNVLPGISTVASKLPNAEDSVPPSFTVPKKRKRQSDREGSTDVKAKQDIKCEKIVSPSLVGVPDNGERDRTVTDQNNGEHQNSNQQQRRSIPKINVGQVCTFMRSAESEKQWSKAKAALSGYLKKKNRDTNASKEPKTKPPRR